MKKAIAIIVSLAALTYIGLAYANEGENSQETNKKQWEQNREARKKEWEQNREQKKTEWEQKREEWKAERSQAIEKWKEEKMRLRLAFKEKFTQERCAKIEEKIKERSAEFAEKKEKHANVYNNLLARIDKFITRFEAFNTANPGKITPESIAKLKADRDQLAKLIADFKTNYADYFAKFSVAKNFTCGETEGQFRSSLVDAKGYLKGVHAAAANIRQFVRETIHPDLLDIKKQIAKAKGETADQD